jgi:hypothetical protein
MCAIDNAIFKIYLSNEVVFQREPGQTLYEGAGMCSFCVRRIEKNDVSKSRLLKMNKENLVDYGKR